MFFVKPGELVQRRWESVLVYYGCDIPEAKCMPLISHGIAVMILSYMNGAGDDIISSEMAGGRSGRETKMNRSRLCKFQEIIQEVSTMELK